MKKSAARLASFALGLGLLSATSAHATISLLAVGTMDSSRAGAFQDVSGLTYPLENGVRANELGGLGSAL
ncbi:MAG TPA: hypothetical protein VMT64_02670, partial [Candidatus Binataceae bacterium]|nr:hypothetical protein [Candidatus Binataceae bacterium]